nr:LruC domain-containing protein [Bacteroidota bacterium]
MVPISSGIIQYTFTTGKSSNEFKVTLEPECNEEGDIIIIQTSGEIVIDDGLTYSLSVDFDGEIDFTNAGGTLKICGNAVANNNIQMNKSTHHIIVTQGGSLTCDDLSLTHADATVAVYSNSLLDINDNFSPKGYVLNYGTIDVEHSWENSGNDSYFQNYGTMLIGKDMNLNSKTENINACKIIVQDKFHQNSPSCIFIMEAGSYLETGDDCTFTRDATHMYEGAMIKCPKFFTNNQSEFTAYGDAIIWVTEDVDIKGDIDGPITVAYEDGVDPDVSGDLTNGANVTPVDEVTLYLPISACNPTGFGAPLVIDTDLDGVPDDLDLYPLDPLRATHSYFPQEGVWGTIAFEDLWPSKGDYDFNDLVVDYTGHYVLNAENYVKDLVINFEVRAIGASFNNGFGFQLMQISPDQIESVTGMVHESADMNILINANGTEQEQDLAVIIPFESAEDIINRLTGGSMFNTVIGGGSGTSVLVPIVVVFEEAVSQANLGPEYFNPFLIKNQNRSVEVHLPNMPPTDLADMSLFGTHNDNSIPAEGRYYKTDNCLPWALNIYERFDYPIERVQVVDAYNYFPNWCQTGGVTYEDWYTNQPGYRNEASIY